MSRFVSFVAAASLATAQYTCKSDKSFGNVAVPSKKGLAVDDNTIKWCPKQVPVEWPNGEGAMNSIRLFRAWDSTWEGEKEDAFDAIAKYAWEYNAKILLGTQITCDEGKDMQSWEWTKELLGKLGPKHVMGLAIGNELELLHMKGAEHVTAGCLDRIWGQGYLWNKFRHMVNEFDSLGFGSVPVTSVFTGLGLAGNPFYEIPQARVKTFLTNATKLYGDRFVFTFNFYPYFDPSQRLDPGTSDQCTQALARASCWGEQCGVSLHMRQARMKIRTLLGKDGTMWVGETGWSSPVSSSLTTNVKACPAWSSLATMESFYRGFLEWDLSIGGGEKVDHAFWFTMRDSSNFGKEEHFGLISTCDDPACKIKSESFQAANYTLHMGPAESQCADDHLFNSWVHGGSVGGDVACRNKCTITPGCWFYGVWPHSHDSQYWCRLTSSCNEQASTDGHMVTTYSIESRPLGDAMSSASGKYLTLVFFLQVVTCVAGPWV